MGNLTLRNKILRMKRVILLVAILSTLYNGGSAQSAHNVATDWPNNWSSHFTETVKIPLRGSQYIEGNWYFDFPNRKFRVDRTNGNFDRYCGTVYKFSDTPCSHIVRDGKR